MKKKEEVIPQARTEPRNFTSLVALLHYTMTVPENSCFRT